MERTNCKYCQAEIAFIVTENGANIPVDWIPFKTEKERSLLSSEGTWVKMQAGEYGYRPHSETCTSAKRKIDVQFKRRRDRYAERIVMKANLKDANGLKEIMRFCGNISKLRRIWQDDKFQIVLNNVREKNESDYQEIIQLKEDLKNLYEASQVKKTLFN
jgi:hypothetical protein